MIVVDTNIIAYLFLTSEHSILVEKAYIKDPSWAAPLLWRSEMRNVLVNYVRRGILTLGGAEEIMLTAGRLMQGNEYEVTSNHVLELANASNCSAYDCEFVALAIDLRTRVLTADRQILSDFASIAVSLDEFTDRMDR